MTEIKGWLIYMEAIKNLFTFVLLATVPFNFLKGLLVSIIFYFVYRSIHCKYCVE